MNPRSGCGRADLLWCLHGIPPEAAQERAFIAELCNFVPGISSVLRPYSEAPDHGAIVGIPFSPSGAPATASTATTELRFWQPVSLAVRTKAEDRQLRQEPEFIQGRLPFSARELGAKTSRSVRVRPLIPWSLLWPFLRHALGFAKPLRAPDLRRLVPRIADGRAMRRIPRRTRMAWNSRADLIIDRRESMLVYQDDYDYVLGRLRKVRGTVGLRQFWVEGGDPTQVITPEPRRRHLRYPPPAAGGSVLVLGDLGCLGTVEPSQRAWTRFGRTLRHNGCIPWALAPCPWARWQPWIASTWRMAVWDRGARLPRRNANTARSGAAVDSPAMRAEKCERLLTLLSAATLVEAPLLRDLRLLLPAGEVDVGTEYDLWNDTAAVSGGVVAVVVRQSVVPRLQSRFRQLPLAQRQELIRRIRYHHHQRYPGVLEGELLLWESLFTVSEWTDLVRTGILSTADTAQAAAFRHRATKTMADHTRRETILADEPALRIASWGDRLWTRSALDVRAQDDIQALAWASQLIHKEFAGATEIPTGIDPDKIAWMLPQSSPERRWQIRQNSSGTLAIAEYRTPDGGVPARLGAMRSIPVITFRSRDPIAILETPATSPVDACRALVQLATDVAVTPGDDSVADAMVWRSDRECYWLQCYRRPAWARRMAVDEFGLYADLKIAGLDRLRPLRLRWIPPGRFTMGSPEDEKGRMDREGPQHEVIISRGFWLAETPCTQEQWQAVMGENPAHFTGENRPVESMSWDECQKFCDKLTGLFPELMARLPSEAEWEYACRAGTERAFNNDDDCTEPEGADPALDRVGWFDKNSGNETHPVKQKQANNWGLYDMHGNVWEWCKDWFGPYVADVVTDPVGPQTGEVRVVRGGGFWDYARHCRSAYRGRWHPSNRGQSIGFRFAAGQPPGQSYTE